MTITPPPERLPDATFEIVGSVAQHRALSTEQVRAIHLPEAGERWVQRILARLARAGYLAHVESSRAPRRLWHATEEGMRIAQDAGAVDRVSKALSSSQVAGPLRTHTLAVNDAAIAFLVAARVRGDDFGPLSWRHEVAHPLGHRRRWLAADAVLTYLRVSEEEVVVEQRFLELDRATLSVERLAAELGRYAQLYRARGDGGEPLWRSLYPSFPSVICVLAGASRPVLERRRDTTLALLRSHPDVSRTPELGIRICLAEDLQRWGPFAAIFTDLRRPGDLIDWIGTLDAGTEGRLP